MLKGSGYAFVWSLASKKFNCLFLELLFFLTKKVAKKVKTTETYQPTWPVPARSVVLPPRFQTFKPCINIYRPYNPRKLILIFDFILTLVTINNLDMIPFWKIFFGKEKYIEIFSFIFFILFIKSLSIQIWSPWFIFFRSWRIFITLL